MAPWNWTSCQLTWNFVKMGLVKHFYDKYCAYGQLGKVTEV